MAYPHVPIWLELTHLARDFGLSLIDSACPHPEFRGLDGVCLFIGPPRTGHSLVASLLDAHPEIAIAHELGMLKYVLTHFSRRQIWTMMLANTKRQAARGRPHIHYSHAVEGQWQGRFQNLRIIGDKHGEGLLLSVAARPRLLDRARERMGPIRFIHVQRNPFDAITSTASVGKRNMSLERSIGYFSQLYATLNGIIGGLQASELCECRFEDLLADPKNELTKLCQFLGVEAPQDYLAACSAIVLDSPEDHRGMCDWEQSSRDKVDAFIDKYSFLSSYSFEDQHRQL